jgi:hypothetical protein
MMRLADATDNADQIFFSGLFAVGSKHANCKVANVARPELARLQAMAEQA